MRRKEEKKETTSRLTLRREEEYAEDGRGPGRQQRNSKEKVRRRKMEAELSLRRLKGITRQNQRPFASQGRAAAHSPAAVTSHRETPKGAPH